MLQSADHDGDSDQNDGEAGDECFCPSWKVLGVWGKRSWGEARHCIVPRPTYINSFTAYIYTSKSATQTLTIFVSISTYFNGLCTVPHPEILETLKSTA